MDEGKVSSSTVVLTRTVPYSYGEGSHHKTSDTGQETKRSEITWKEGLGLPEYRWILTSYIDCHTVSEGDKER